MTLLQITHTHTHTTRIIPIPNNLLTNNLICRSKPYIYTLVVPKRSSLRVSPRASFPARTSSGTTKTYQNFLLPTPTPEFVGNITRTKKHVAQQHTFTKQIKFKSFSEHIPIELLCNRRSHTIYIRRGFAKIIQKREVWGWTLLIKASYRICFTTPAHFFDHPHHLPESIEST